MVRESACTRAREHAHEKRSRACEREHARTRETRERESTRARHRSRARERKRRTTVLLTLRATHITSLFTKCPVLINPAAAITYMRVWERNSKRAGREDQSRRVSARERVCKRGKTRARLCGMRVCARASACERVWCASVGGGIHQCRRTRVRVRLRTCVCVRVCMCTCVCMRMCVCG